MSQYTYVWYNSKATQVLKKKKKIRNFVGQ